MFILRISLNTNDFEAFIDCCLNAVIDGKKVQYNHREFFRKSSSYVNCAQGILQKCSKIRKEIGLFKISKNITSESQL